MKKNKISMACIIVSILLAIAFVAVTIIDYKNYNPMVTSAPFEVNILINALCYLVPALIALIAGIVIKKRG